VSSTHNRASSLRRLSDLLLRLARRWGAIFRLVPTAGPGLVTVAVLGNLLLGLLPIAFVIGTSTMISRVESDVGAHGGLLWAPVVPALALAGAALVVQNLLTPFQAVVGELVMRRVDGRRIRRLIRSSLIDASMGALEEPAILSNLNDARSGLTQSWQTPGSAVVGLLALVTRYAQMLGAAAVVAVVLGPAAGAVLAASVYLARVGWRYALTGFVLFSETQGGPRRSMGYMCDTGANPALGKEMRVLGMTGWFKERTEADCRSYYLPIWQKRVRLCVGPFVVYAVVLVTGITAVLLMLRDRMSGLSVFQLTLALQCIFIAIAFAAFFPEADFPTQFGMQTNDAVIALERRFGQDAKQVASGNRDAAGAPRSSIRFAQVCFCYPGSDRNVLDGLDLELRAGESTAIVGLNGAGKTTLVKLLAGLYEPDAGAIFVDGVGLAEYDRHGWQRRLAVIFQSYARYELEARANVVLGAPERLEDDPAFERAVRRTGAHEIIERLPAKEQTTLSSRYRGGVDLSGGQWQRVALARALFAVEAGAGVLVLDEPTAQLDVRAEVAFFESFLELTRGLTTLVISHRFSTVRRADRIVVLEGGRLIEDGSHHELIAHGGRYAELFALQSSRFARGLPEDDLGPAASEHAP
jgi:ATP-binding cassette subfamily B protein